MTDKPYRNLPPHQRGEIINTDGERLEQRLITLREARAAGQLALFSETRPPVLKDPSNPEQGWKIADEPTYGVGYPD